MRTGAARAELPLQRSSAYLLQRWTFHFLVVVIPNSFFLEHPVANWILIKPASGNVKRP